MKGKPANNQETIREMESGLAILENALCHPCPEPAPLIMADDTLINAALIRQGIEDLKAALFYAYNELVCPGCMTPNLVDSRVCCNCGLEFDI